MGQISHQLEIDLNSIGQFDDFNPSDKESHLTSNVNFGYRLNNKLSSFQFGIGYYNKNITWQGPPEPTSIYSTSSSFGLNFNYDLMFLETTKLNFGITCMSRIYWEFYSFKNRNIQNNIEITFKKKIELDTPMLQFVIGPKLNYNPFGDFNMYTVAGISVENFKQFASSFSTDFSVWGLFQFGLNYQFNLSKKSSSE